jgi:hypothetical protein
VLTLGPRTARLLAVGTDALTDAVPVGLSGGRLLSELAEMLRARNGFYAFESALHVFASGDQRAAGDSLEAWNEPTTWRAGYDGLAESFLFFAEDVFGSQFAIRNERVYVFDPETGSAEPMASSVEDWADQLLSDYEMLTGFPLAHRWQQANGPIPAGQRLVPKIPFVLGGDFEISNVYLVDAREGMRTRSELAVQIRDLPDGAQVQYRVVE